MEKVKLCYLKIDSDKMCTAALICIMFYNIINTGITTFFGVLGLHESKILLIFLLGVEGFIIYVTLAKLVIKNVIPFFFLYGIISILFVITIIVFPENISVLLGNPLKRMFLFCMPATIIAMNIKEYHCFWAGLKKASYIITICGLISFFFSEELAQGYSMSFGYQLTIPSMVLLYNIITKSKKSFVDLLFFSLNSLIILLRGSRGPLLILFCYFFVCIFEYRVKLENKSGKKYAVRKKSKHSYSSKWSIFIIIFTTTCICIVLNLEKIFYKLYNVFLNIGYDSRTLRVLSIKNALLYSAGRDRYIATAIELIKKSPWFGYGLAGDSVQIGKSFNADPSLYSGMYAHNILLGLMLHFGVFLGLLLLIIFIVLIRKKLKENSEISFMRSTIILLTTYTLILSMISSTYLELVQLWLLLGVVISRSNNKCEQKKCSGFIRIN